MSARPESLRAEQTSRAVHHYRAFGLAIASDLALPELLPAPEGPADLTIRIVDTGRTFPALDAPGEFRFGDAECFLLYPQIGAFRVCAPDLIEVEPRAGVEPALIGFPLLGPVMALLLQARGFFLLHGSALAVNGKACGFLGDKGAGKSTTAGAFLRAGHGLITDDIIAIAGLESGPGHIQPAFPQVKLTRAASAALASVDLAERPGVPYVREKQRYLLEAGFAEETLAPGHFFLLKRGERLGLEWLDAPLRMKAFLRFSYGTRFGMRAITPAIAARHARQCTGLANRAKAAILTVPDDLAALGEVVDFVAAAIGD
ncbi:MAG: serine kinase [Porphyrobacter sp.]|nr:serine kinase [Porphyrobacter sp.]